MGGAVACELCIYERMETNDVEKVQNSLILQQVSQFILVCSYDVIKCVFQSSTGRSNDDIFLDISKYGKDAKATFHCA